MLRDGQEQRIPGRDVVCGDLLVLHEGDRVAADAVLLDGQLEVDESLLTGESVPVAKLPRPSAPGSANANASAQDEEAHQLYASTVVTRGVGIAQVCATGARTAVGRIGADLACTVEPPSALQQDSRTLVLGVILLVLANRDLTHPAWHGITDPNPWLRRMAGVMGLLLLAVLGIPWLRELMGLALPGTQGWLAVAALLALCMAWLELLRRASRLWQGRRGSR